MGLAQNILFEYDNKNEVENFLNDFCKDFLSEKQGDLYIITSDGNNKFKFEIAIEDNGLYTHRSGQYFEFLGILVEQLTGEFGKIEIEDI